MKNRFKKNVRHMIDKIKSPIFRHGYVSVGLFVLFVALMVVLVVEVQNLENANNWKKDMSFNQYASTTQETDTVLKNLQNSVELYLLYQSDEDIQLLQVLKRYEASTDEITVKETDINLNPGILTRFQGDETNTVSADTVIVNCPETGRYKILSYNDFLVSGYNIDSGSFELEGLSYEKNITEAIVNVSSDIVPVVGFMQGHGEIDIDTMTVMTDELKSAGYESKAINLLRGDTLEGVDLLIFASPLKDLSEAEIAVINEYAQSGGRFFVMRDYTDPLENMSNYLSFLKNYGVVPVDGVVVASEQDQGSYYENPIYLLPYMTSIDLTLPLKSTNRDVLLMPAASAFKAPEEGDTSLASGSVLITGPNAYVRNLSDGIDSLEMQPGDTQGEITVAVYGHRMHANGNVSAMFAAGSSSMFITDYIYQRTYCSEFLQQIVGSLVPSKSVKLNIGSVSAVRPGLTVGSQGKALTIIVALPVLIIILGMAILIPRKRR